MGTHQVNRERAAQQVSSSESSTSPCPKFILYNCIQWLAKRLKHTRKTNTCSMSWGRTGDSSKKGPGQRWWLLGETQIDQCVSGDTTCLYQLVPQSYLRGAKHTSTETLLRAQMIGTVFANSRTAETEHTNSSRSSAHTLYTTVEDRQLLIGMFNCYWGRFSDKQSIHCFKKEKKTQKQRPGIGTRGPG